MFDLGKDGMLKFFRDIHIEGKTGGLGTVADVALSADTEYVYVGNMMNGRIWILPPQPYDQQPNRLRVFERVFVDFFRKLAFFRVSHCVPVDASGC